MKIRLKSIYISHIFLLTIITHNVTNYTQKNSYLRISPSIKIVIMVEVMCAKY